MCVWCAGRSPFEGASKDEIKAAILGYRMRPLPAFLTPGCQDFILQAMCPRAEDRPGAYDLLKHPWVQLHCTPADLVAVARLPLQVPRVPMGFKPASGKQRSRTGGAAAAAADDAATAGNVTSSSSSNMAPAAAASSDVSSSSARVQQDSAMAGKMKQECVRPSSPSSPQIPAFIPAANSGSGRSSRDSGAVGDLQSCGSSSSAHSGTASMADSAASLYQSAGLAAGCEQGWPVNRQQQQQPKVLPPHEPIYERPGDELAAAELQQKQRQQRQQAPQMQPPTEEVMSPRSRKPGGSKLFKWICMSPESESGVDWGGCSVASCSLQTCWRGLPDAEQLGVLRWQGVRLYDDDFALLLFWADG